MSERKAKRNYFIKNLKKINIQKKIMENKKMISEK